MRNQVESGKYVKVGDTQMFNTELIYTRVIGIQGSSREIDIKQLLSYELSPVPIAMFSEYGEMKVAKAKSVLRRYYRKRCHQDVSRKQTPQL